MARRSGLLEVSVDIASRFPWWVGVLLALVSYIGFHALAGITVTTPKNVQDIGAVVAGNI